MIRLFRLAHWLHQRRVPLLPWLLYAFNRIVFGIVLPPSVSVGRNVTFGYHGLATVVHARARIGDRCVVAQGVTIGGRGGHHEVPVIGSDVQIGAGACVLGPVRIGDGARIGANAIVVRDVPAGWVCVCEPRGSAAAAIGAGRRAWSGGRFSRRLTTAPVALAVQLPGSPRAWTTAARGRIRGCARLPRRTRT